MKVSFHRHGFLLIVILILGGVLSACNRPKEVEFVEYATPVATLEAIPTSVRTADVEAEEAVAEEAEAEEAVAEEAETEEAVAEEAEAEEAVAEEAEAEEAVAEEAEAEEAVAEEAVAEEAEAEEAVTEEAEAEEAVAEEAVAEEAEAEEAVAEEAEAEEAVTEEAEAEEAETEEVTDASEDAVAMAASDGAEGADDPRLPQELWVSMTCSACHNINENQTEENRGPVGPHQNNLYERAGERIDGMSARDYIYNSIVNPGDYLVEGYADVMPKTLAESMTEEEIWGIVDWMLDPAREPADVP